MGVTMLYKRCVLFLSVFSNLLCFSLQAKSADYVIIGVGTSGAVLAKMLSDDKTNSVIALHNGPNLTQDPLIKFSKNALTTVSDALLGPPFFINGVTSPQVNADNQDLLWAMALPEGGSSSINAGAYCRGTRELYSRWEAIAGARWSVERIFKIYQKLESYHGRTPNPAARGYHGPVTVRQVAHPSKISKTFSKATIEGTGFPFVLDYNNPDTPIGVSPQLQYTQKGPKGALRVSSATAFLNKKVMTSAGFGVNARKLRVLFESTATRIIWEGTKAVAVEYVHQGKIKKISVKKAVIVSAGLYSSAFLMHSGIGPAALLNSLDIPLVCANPNVGQGLADQPHVLTLFSANPKDFPTRNLNSPFDQIAWLPDPDNDPKKREIRFSTISAVPGVTLGLVDLVQPRSRGSITINSRDPLAPPIIDYGILSNPKDLNLFQKAFQVYIKSINTALQAIDPLYQLISPDPAILDDISLLTAFIRKNIGSNQSFQSHCRMAPRNRGGVVDSAGHVYGVQNVIVADDSIVPLCMDGSSMATAYLIAVNIAQIILDSKP